MYFRSELFDDDESAALLSLEGQILKKGGLTALLAYWKRVMPLLKARRPPGPRNADERYGMQNLASSTISSSKKGE